MRLDEGGKNACDTLDTALKYETVIHGEEDRSAAPTSCISETFGSQRY